jgi:predicted Zn-dependent peptidase
VGTREFDAIDLAFIVLGSGQTSRLHKALVRHAELAEATSASTLGLVGGTSYGIAYARARHDVTPERLEETVVGEVDRLVRDGVTETELRRAQAQYERHWLHELARIDSRADALGEYATLHGDPSLVNTRLVEIDSITADDVATAAARWLGGDRCATLTYRRAAR